MNFLLFLISLNLFLSSIYTTPCPNLCSGHGVCSSGHDCECHSDYIGFDCSQRECPYGTAWADEVIGIDDGHNSAECSNRGICDRNTGKCICQDGFEGNNCGRFKCPNNCNHHGKCKSMKYYAKGRDPGELDKTSVYKYDNIWDSEMIYGCDCDVGYTGYDCSLRECPIGDDPLTGTSEDPNGEDLNEIQIITCKATSGTFTISFRGKTTSNLDYDISTSDLQDALHELSTISGTYEDGVSIYYDGSETEACSESGNDITIEFLQEFGDLPLLQVDGTSLVHSGNSIDPSISVTTSVDGTKEDNYCSDRGICSLSTGICSCFDDFDTSNGYGEEGRRGDCGYTDKTILTCPGIISCSGHGVCNDDPTYDCECSDGWTGGDCAEMTCPTGTSWFDYPTSNNDAHNTLTECSNMGICDRNTGTCICHEGFEGSACDRLKCPRNYNGEICNGHGQCMSMELLALNSNDNGDETSYTYGDTPNNAATWDYESIQGCHCDTGYTGYDCSLRTCPYGDDPYTKTNQVNEIQKITCKDIDNSGTFKLSFRQDVTDSIDVSSTMEDIETYLEELDTFRDVTVSLVDSTAIDIACNSTGSVWQVEFLTEHGTVPLIKVDENININSIKINQTQADTRDSFECSGRGLCNYETGECNCFSGFGSSDGQGNSGTLGECGYILPYQSVYNPLNKEKIYKNEYNHIAGGYGDRYKQYKEMKNIHLRGNHET